MPELATLEEAKMLLRVDHPFEDDLIRLMIAAASEAVRDVATDWDGESPVPDRIKLAVLARVANMFNRDHRNDLRPSMGELPLLTPLRKLEV